MPPNPPGLPALHCRPFPHQAPSLVLKETPAGPSPPPPPAPPPAAPAEDSYWPVLLYEVSLSRQNLIYSLKILTPQVVLTMVAFSTFWLSPECGER